MAISESQIYNHANELLRSHDVLLRDAVRNRAFYAALERTVNSDSKVLDIGAGSGIWAITAAKLGARHVVAIEMDEFLIGLIKMLAVEHGVADRVETVWGNSVEIQLEKEFDIVVSETIGYLGFDENIAEIMRDARDRFLKPGGKLIPETISLHAAPAHLKDQEEIIPAGLDLGFTGLSELAYHSPFLPKHPDEFEIVADPVCLIETDLYSPNSRSPDETLSATWTTGNALSANCFVVWVESRLTEGVTLSTRDTTSWTPTLFRFEPFSDDPGQLRFELELDRKGVSWTIIAGTGEASIVRQYSPAFAAAEMLAAARGIGPVEIREGRMYMAATAPEIALRPVNDDDRQFLVNVYSSVRRAEFASLGWSDEQLDGFLAMQLDIQTRAYAMQCPDAASSVILAGGECAGRLVVDRSGDQITLVDIAVLPEFKRTGIATYLIRQLQNEAAAAGRFVLLHVEKVNGPALNLYKKLGFEISGETELHYEMTWTIK